jgi:hypothetical protein
MEAGSLEELIGILRGLGYEVHPTAQDAKSVAKRLRSRSRS